MPKVGNEIIQTALPEAMVTLDTENEILSNGQIEGISNVVCIGQSIGKSDKTSKWLIETLRDTDFPMVLDCLLYTSPSPRDGLLSRMPSSA